MPGSRATTSTTLIPPVTGGDCPVHHLLVVARYLPPGPSRVCGPSGQPSGHPVRDDTCSYV